MKYDLEAEQECFDKLHRLGGVLTVVSIDEMWYLRRVVDELDLADLPHLGAFFTKLLQHTPTEASLEVLQGGQTGL